MNELSSRWTLAHLRNLVMITQKNGDLTYATESMATTVEDFPEAFAAYQKTLHYQIAKKALEGASVTDSGKASLLREMIGLCVDWVGAYGDLSWDELRSRDEDREPDEAEKEFGPERFRERYEKDANQKPFALRSFD